MSYFFSPNIKEELWADPEALHLTPLRIVLFRTAPSMSEDAGTPWAGVNTVDELLEYPGWEEVVGIPGYDIDPDDGSPMTMPTIELSLRPFGSEVPWTPGDPPAFENNYYYTFSNYTFHTDPINIGAIGFERVSDGLLVLVTNTPTNLSLNVMEGDQLTASEDTVNFPDDASSKRWVLQWAKVTAGGAVNPQEGPLVILKSPPAFEVSNTLHIWMYPQRANMIVNPSFELDAQFWTPIPERVALSTVEHNVLGGAWAGKFTQEGPFAIESNVWPTAYGTEESELWTIQMMIKSGPIAEGTKSLLKIGLAYWDADYRGTGIDWGTNVDFGTETWQLMSDAWIHVACVRHAPQAFQAMVRLEVSGSEVTLDKVLAERGALKEWPYFDGDSLYAAPNDYSWYGGEQMSHQSYSIWYSGRRAAIGRLFASPVITGEPGDLVTDEDVRNAGLVYQWVPAGVTVVPHLDVFYPNDLRLAPPPRTKGLLPYYDPIENPMGVPPPWNPGELEDATGEGGGGDTVALPLTVTFPEETESPPGLMVLGGWDALVIDENGLFPSLDDTGTWLQTPLITGNFASAIANHPFTIIQCAENVHGGDFYGSNSWLQLGSNNDPEDTYAETYLGFSGPNSVLYAWNADDETFGQISSEWSTDLTDMDSDNGRITYAMVWDGTHLHSYFYRHDDDTALFTNGEYVDAPLAGTSFSLPAFSILLYRASASARLYGFHIDNTAMTEAAIRALAMSWGYTGGAAVESLPLFDDFERPDGAIGSNWVLGVPVLSDYDTLFPFTIEDGAAVGPEMVTESFGDSEAASMLWTTPHPGEHQVIEVVIENFARAVPAYAALNLQNFINPATGAGWMCQLINDTEDGDTTYELSILNYFEFGEHWDDFSVTLPGPSTGTITLRFESYLSTGRQVVTYNGDVLIDELWPMPDPADLDAPAVPGAYQGMYLDWGSYEVGTDTTGSPRILVINGNPDV